MACVAVSEGSHNPIISCIIRSQEQIRAWEIRAGHVVRGLGLQSQVLLLNRGEHQGLVGGTSLVVWFDFYTHFIL